MSRFSARFSEKEYGDLVKLSFQKERSINELIREAVRQYVEKETLLLKPVESREIPCCFDTKAENLPVTSR